MINPNPSPSGTINFGLLSNGVPDEKNSNLVEPNFGGVIVLSEMLFPEQESV